MKIVKSPPAPVQKEGPAPEEKFVENHEYTSAYFDASGMMDFNIDDFDTTLLYDLFINSSASPSIAHDPFSATDSETDVLQEAELLPVVESSYLKEHNTGTTGVAALSPIQVRRQQQQQNQQSYLSEHASDARSPVMIPQQQVQRQNQQSSRHIGNTSASCQCIPHLISLLHDLKFSDGDKTPQVGIDSMLVRTSDAIARWSTFASCPHCQNNDNEDDDGETLLIAALAIRRVVAQLKAIGLQPGVSKETDEVEGPQLRFGAFQIAGSDRTVLLRVLQTITFRKLDTVVHSMQSMLKPKLMQCNGADNVILTQVKAILAELAKAVKVQ